MRTFMPYVGKQMDSSSSEEEQSGPIKYGNSEARHPLKKDTGERIT